MRSLRAQRGGKERLVHGRFVSATVIGAALLLLAFDVLPVGGSGGVDRKLKDPCRSCRVKQHVQSAHTVCQKSLFGTAVLAVPAHPHTLPRHAHTHTHGCCTCFHRTPPRHAHALTHAHARTHAPLLPLPLLQPQLVRALRVLLPLLLLQPLPVAVLLPRALPLQR